MNENQNKDIEALLEIFDASDWQELSLKTGDLQLFLSKDADAKGLAPQAKPAAKTQSAAPESTAQKSSTQAESQPQQEDADTDTEGQVAIRAANVGTFYRAPKPGEPPYVEVGDSVTADTEVCLIEVMKLFTPQQAGVAGIIRKICVEDAQMVEYDQPLFYVDPKE